MESTIESQNIVMPEWDFNNPSTMEAWDLASGAYAERVSGEIRAVIEAELRTGNIWENVELSRLMENQNETKITTLAGTTKYTYNVLGQLRNMATMNGRTAFMRKTAGMP